MAVRATPIVHNTIVKTAGHASEVKFLIPLAAAVRVAEWARQHLAADPHGTGPDQDTYVTTTLYFDTAGRDVFHRRGSFGRSKYRARRYGAAESVFLERKLRRGLRLAKRRTIVPVARLARLGKVPPKGDSARWFERRLIARGLAPVAQITYRRIARADEASGARLTIDDQLSAVRVDGPSFRPDRGTPLVAGQAIVEMKYRGIMPSFFKEAAERFGLVPGRISKYRIAAEALGLSADPQSGEPGADPEKSPCRRS